MKQRKAFLPALAALACIVAGAAASSCAKDLNATVDNQCPSRDVFEGADVSAYMEKRCGTMDCHGGMARPMRLYGRLGLRYATEEDKQKKEDNTAGGKATTDEERHFNHQAVCSVEPEKMSDQAKDSGNSADQLLMIKKMRGLEKHKGGKITVEGDPADNCILGWLRIPEPKDPTNAKFLAAKAAVKSECDKALQELQ